MSKTPFSKALEVYYQNFWRCIFRQARNGLWLLSTFLSTSFGLWCLDNFKENITLTDVSCVILISLFSTWVVTAIRESYKIIAEKSILDNSKKL